MSVTREQAKNFCKHISESRRVRDAFSLLLGISDFDDAGWCTIDKMSTDDFDDDDTWELKRIDEGIVLTEGIGTFLKEVGYQLIEYAKEAKAKREESAKGAKKRR